MFLCLDSDTAGAEAATRLVQTIPEPITVIRLVPARKDWNDVLLQKKDIDITAAVRSLLFIGKLKDSPTTRVLIHEKSSLAPPGQSLAFSLGDEKGFEWIGAYDITADELLAGTDTAKTESKTAQAQMLILELLADGKRMPSAELEKAVNERGISSRTMRTAKSRIGDRLVTEKDGTAWVCYLRD